MDTSLLKVRHREAISLRKVGTNRPKLGIKLLKAVTSLNKAVTSLLKVRHKAVTDLRKAAIRRLRVVTKHPKALNPNPLSPVVPSLKKARIVGVWSSLW